MPRVTSFVDLPSNLVLPKNWLEATAAFIGNNSDDVPDAWLRVVKPLAPDLWLVSNLKPTFHPDSRVVTDATITLVYKGVVCVTYTPSGWIFLNHEGLKCPQLQKIFSLVLDGSALDFHLEAGNEWRIRKYGINPDGTRGSYQTSYSFTNWMALYPSLGHVNCDPYRPAN